MSDPQRPSWDVRTPPGGVTPEQIIPALRVVADCEEAVIYRRAQRFLVRVLAWIAIGFGLALLLGREARFSSTPSFAYADAMPGTYTTWGTAALLIGVFTYVSSFHWHRRGVMLGLLAQCVAFAFFAITIGVSALQDRTSPFTGVVIYGGYSVICSVAYVTGHELRKVQRGTEAHA